MIRIADVPHPKPELAQTKSQDEISSSVRNRSKIVDTHDDIYNIRSRSKAPSMDRRSSRINRMDRGDEDPGLRKSEDFKQKQVPIYNCVLYVSFRLILGRSLKVKCCCGLPINQLESSMVTSGPVLSTSTHRHSALRHPVRTLLEFCL
jgi:hypothetical protein